MARKISNSVQKRENGRPNIRTENGENSAKK